MVKRGPRHSAMSTTPTPASESPDLVYRLQAEVTRLRHHVSVLSRRLNECEKQRAKAWDVLRSYPPPPIPPCHSFVGLSPSPSEPATEALVRPSPPYGAEQVIAPFMAQMGVAAIQPSLPCGVKRRWSESESESTFMAAATRIPPLGPSGPPTQPAAASRRIKKKKRSKQHQAKVDTSELVPLESSGGEKGAVDLRVGLQVDLHLEEMEPHLCPVRKLGDGKVVWRCPCEGSFVSDRHDYVPGLRYHWAHHACTEIKMFAVGLVDDEAPDAPLVCCYCGIMDD